MLETIPRRARKVLNEQIRNRKCCKICDCRNCVEVRIVGRRLMNTSDIQNLLCKREASARNFVCANVHHLLAMSECDVLSYNEKSGYLTEYEVKISRSDFKADLKKYKWLFLKSGVTEGVHANKFNYVCPTGLIAPEEVPEFAGLIWIDNGKIITKKAAKFIHKNKMDKTKVLTKFCRVLQERTYLGGCLLTVKNNEIKERRKAREEKKICQTNY